MLPRMPRFLAIDLGDRRTGLALGDDATGIASPLPAIAAPPGPERWTQLTRIVEREAPDALVLGLPLHMDGTSGKVAAKSRTFAAEAADRFALPVHLVDERQSSLEADEAMAQERPHPPAEESPPRRPRRRRAAPAFLRRGRLVALKRIRGQSESGSGGWQGGRWKGALAP